MATSKTELFLWWAIRQAASASLASCARVSKTEQCDRRRSGKWLEMLHKSSFKYRVLLLLCHGTASVFVTQFHRTQPCWIFIFGCLMNELPVTLYLLLPLTSFCPVTSLLQYYSVELWCDITKQADCFTSFHLRLHLFGSIISDILPYWSSHYVLPFLLDLLLLFTHVIPGAADTCYYRPTT